jgi:hypothetical protein
MGWADERKAKVPKAKRRANVAKEGERIMPWLLSYLFRELKI